MSYRQRRRLYSQNFLRNPKLVNKLVRNSSIGKLDIVIEIGPGKGSITKELMLLAGKVVAIEVDHKLTLHLNNYFYSTKNIEVVNSDFLNFGLPHYPYKVFANIPFHITASVIRKLTEDVNFSEGYLVVQEEFAKKVIGKPYDDKNSMMATLLKPWFDISIYHKFSRHDFVPFPHVDSVMIKISRLREPFVPYYEKDSFRDFVLHKYNKEKFASLDFDQILSRFRHYVSTATEKEKEMVKIDATKITKAQENIIRVHRTRNDKNWRKYK